jgi:hypothetical protein
MYYHSCPVFEDESSRSFIPEAEASYEISVIEEAI